MIGLIIVAALFSVTAAVLFTLAHRSRSYIFGNLEVVLILAVVGVVLLIGAPGIVGVTGGLLPGYSTGEREGYITKISHRGVIWKTWEGQIQVGTGNMAALQEPWGFSVVEEEILSEIQENLGNRVRVTYKEWLMQPFNRGSSGYEITSVGVLEVSE